MRKGVFPLLCALTVLLVALPPRADASGGVSISFFFDELSPHGDWVTVGSYGHCWRPRGVDRYWQPYVNGEWVYTEDGWTWLSNDPWGGDPYHYGTWSLSNAYGWVWIPGTIWAPAWVTWYVGDNDIGWAPVPPSFSVGIAGYRGPAVTVSRASYVFVPAARFVGVNVGSVRVPVAENARLFARTRPVTRFSASGGVLTIGGPTVAQVERATRRKIARVGVSDAHTRAVPLDSALRNRRSNVIAPAPERARFIAPQAVKAGRESAPAPRQSTTARREGPPPVREKARVAAEKPAPKRNVPREQAAAPVRERQEPARSQAEHVRKVEPAPPVARPAAPAPERHDALRVEANRPPQKPAETQPQGGKDHEPKKDHDREKGN